jgi:hypothetical protein
MRQDRDLRAPCRTYVLVGTAVSPTAFAKRPTYACSAADLTAIIGSSDQPLPGPAAADATPADRDQEPPIPDYDKCQAYIADVHSAFRSGS